MTNVPIYDGRRIAFYTTAGDVPGIRSVTPKQTVGRMRLSTEAIGAMTLSFSGVKAGSEIYVFDVNRNVLAGTESATNPQSFSLSVYSSGNPLNNIRILIASLGYENIDLSYTISTSSVTIPIQQRIDRNYKNPI